MERDEETGLAYHGARYYAPWMARWTASDPIGLGDGVNRYRYTQNNPTGFVDRTGTRAGDPIPDSFETGSQNGEDVSTTFEDESVRGSLGSTLVQPKSVAGQPAAGLPADDGDPGSTGEILANPGARPGTSVAAQREQNFLFDVQLGKATPDEIPERNTAITGDGGLIVGFAFDKLGTGGDIQQVADIAGNPIGEFPQGNAQQDFSIELAALDLLTLRGAVGVGRQVIGAALRKRAVNQALKKESARQAAEVRAGLPAGSQPAAGADALIEGQARVAAARAEAGAGARLRMSGEGGAPRVTILEEEGGAIHFTVKVGDDTLEVLSGIRREGDTIFLEKLHIQKTTGEVEEAFNTVGVRNLFAAAKAFGKSQGASVVEVHGFARSTGSTVGRTPRPMVIRMDR